MGDGVSEVNNRPVPRRKNHGDDVYIGGKYEKEYSDELDYSIGSTSLNAHPRLNLHQHNPKKFSRKLRGKTGLIFKEPLY